MNANHVQFRNFIPEDLLLRALLKNAFLINLSDAFMLRDSERGSGLSVNFDCTIAECRAGFKRSFGVASLIVESVLQLDLQIVADEPTHALILGVPHKEDDPVRAEWLASRLAESATIIDRGKQESL
jgi:hypothetical protein